MNMAITSCLDVLLGQGETRKRVPTPDISIECQYHITFKVVDEDLWREGGLGAR